jgi:hypothetical protein
MNDAQLLIGRDTREQVHMLHPRSQRRVRQRGDLLSGKHAAHRQPT